MEDFLIKNHKQIKFVIVTEWKQEHCRKRLGNKVLYTTVGHKCYKITYQSSNEVSEPQCHQEEADGRLLFHARHAATNEYQAVVICSEDTDVFTMAFAFQDTIGVHLFQKCGTKT